MFETKSSGLRNLAISLFFLGLMVLIGDNVGPYNQSQLAAVSIILIAILSINLLTGDSGQLSLGQGAVMAVGGYAAALSVLKAGFSIWLAFLFAILISAIFGLILGLAAARLSGPYLAGTTLVLALALPTIANRFETFLGGDVGLSVDIGSAPSWLINIFGDFSIERWQLFSVLPFSALALFAVLNISGSRTGRAMRAVRDNDVAASLSGINISRTKIFAFVLASALAGLAGALYGFRGLVGPSVYPVDLSLALLTGAVIGGIRSIPGAVIGSFVVIFLPDVIGNLAQGHNLSEQLLNYLPALVSGLLLLVTIIINPAGLAALGKLSLPHRRHQTGSK